MRGVTTVLALLCFAAPPSCHGFLAPSIANLRPIVMSRSSSSKSAMSMRAAPESSTRRAYFVQLLFKSVATVAISGASSLVIPPGLSYAFNEPSSRWVPEGDPKAASSWFPLLAKCYDSLEDVLTNWDKYTVKQDGDAIRRLIGTIGVSSPLSSIRKAFVSIRDAEEESQGDIDVIAYVEAYMEVLTALGDAENDLYSANFADYSGGGGTKGSQFITKANKSLKIAKNEFKEVNRILGI